MGYMRDVGVAAAVVRMWPYISPAHQPLFVV